jgi:uncharacterized damage-inducible protein DinB
MTAPTLLHSLFKYKAWANDELFTELAKVDPVANQADRHAAIRIINHTYVVDRIFAGHLTGVPHGYEATNTPETPNLDELRARVSESDRWYVDYVGKLSSESLTEKLSFAFTDGQKGSMSREEILAHVITHGGYHRGAAGRIMAQVSVPPPRDTFTVFLHRTEPGRRGDDNEPA